MHNRHRSPVLPIVCLATILLAAPALSHAMLYRDSEATVDARTEDLLSRMTAEEKFWQLFMLAGEFDGDETRYTDGLFGLQVTAHPGSTDVVERANDIQRHFVEDTRLGIPVIFFAEALHGLVQRDATIFPQAIGLAASFDTALVHEVARAAAVECRSRGVRQVLSPVVNIASDVRWGRVEETYGEDPYLASEMGVAFVSAFEPTGVITTPKHWIANVGDGGRDSYPIEFSERLLREIHVPPFRACIERGGSRSVMAAYNSVDGSPCTANDWLNNRLLKREMGFEGFLISDAAAVGGSIVLHFTAESCADATEQAMERGLDVIFQTSYDHNVPYGRAFREGLVDSARIDDAVARVLRAKFELGLFEEPYVRAGKFPEPGGIDHRALARRAAREVIVLLKNESVLPLGDSVTSIAVLGPDAVETRMGGYSAPAARSCSILDGIVERAGESVAVHHAVGCSRSRPEYEPVPPDFLFCRKDGEVVPGLLGQYYDNVSLDGEPAFERVDSSVNFGWTLFSPDPGKLGLDFYSVRWAGTLEAPVSGTVTFAFEGNDGYRFYLDDKLVIDNWTMASHSVVAGEAELIEGQEYEVRLECVEPTGYDRVRFMWDVGAPPSEDASIQEAVELAARCDAAVMAVGIEEGEFRDRALLTLPGRQEELIARVAETGTPVVVVLIGGSAVVMSEWLDDVTAVLAAWYPGEEGGRAVADIIFGDESPAGRLPVSFPAAEGQLPLVYGHKPTGRGDDYLDFTGRPRFPFGHGLSYTTFEYDDLRLEPDEIGVGEAAVASFTITNTGDREGDEVVQLYIHDELASVARPVMSLQGFERVRLAPGESRELSLPITSRALSLLGHDLERRIEPGYFAIMIGASSRDIRLRDTLSVVE